jgi:tetratricopeptide (TPR) repeat protein
MADLESEERSYQDYLEVFYDTLSLLKKQLDETMPAEELYKLLVTVEDSLETLLNWIKLEKNALRNLDTIVDWSKKLVLDSTLTTDDVRHRLRVIILPQVESFTQNLTTGEKSALKVLDAIKKNLEDLPQFLKDVQQQNFKILSSIGFEPDDGTSYLDLALFNLYQGRFKEYEKEIKSFKESIKSTLNGETAPEV